MSDEGRLPLLWRVDETRKPGLWWGS